MGIDRLRFSIRSIDFDSDEILIEVVRPLSLNQYVEMSDFIDHCQTLGFKHIRFNYHKRMPAGTIMMLRDIEARFTGVTIGIFDDAELEGWETDRRHGKSTGPGWGSGRRTAPRTSEYYIHLSDMVGAVDRVNRSVLLIGSSVPLDSDCLSYLQLCVYELAANTTEHSSFASRSPEIELRIITEPKRVSVAYRDNGKRFSTADRPPVNVREKIMQRSKRGLGLFLLKSLAQSLEYVRGADWNHTTFNLKRSLDSHEQPTGRTKVRQFQTKVTPIDSSDAVVLKITGSLNSTTAPALHDELARVIEDKHYEVIVDLKDTDFVSSSGLCVLLGAVNDLRDRGGDLILMNLPKVVTDVFAVLNIKNHFRTIDSLEELGSAQKS